MNYSLQNIPEVNPSLNIDSSGRGRVVAAVDGEIKVLQCSPKALEKVLDSIDGIKTFFEIEESLSAIYPLDGVRNYLSALVAENIICLTPQTLEEDPERPTVLLIGEGFLKKAVENEAAACGAHYIDVAFTDFDSSFSEAFDVAIVAPDAATYGQMLSVNKELVRRKKPFLPFYFSGKELVCGPFIMAGETACFECQTNYHMQAVNAKLEDSVQITLVDLSMLSVCFPLPMEYNSSLVNRCANIVWGDAERCFSDQEAISCLGFELRYLISYPYSQTKISYSRTTECNCCHGGCSNYEKWNPGLSDDTLSVFSLSEKTPIVYSVGGMRSCGSDETKRFIDEAFVRAGLKISIERMSNSPLQNILPCFQAVLNVSRNNKTPYSFTNVVSRGKGLNENQAYLSAAFELAERASAQSNGEIPIIEATYPEVFDQAIDINSLMNSIKNTNTGYTKLFSNTSLDWVWATSIVTGEKKLVPAFMVFMGNTKFKGQFMGGGSSGLAAGVSLEDAILQALLEVVEHDAWMIGQANQVRLPVVDIMTSENEELKDRIRSINSFGYRVMCRDYSNDIGIPVFRSWIVNPSNHSHYAVNGFGASLSAEIALERSITEAALTSMYSTERVVRFGVPSAVGLANSIDSLYGLSHFQWKDIVEEKPSVSILDKPTYCPSSVKNAIDSVVNLIRTRIPDCDILVVDLTKDVLEIPVVRVIVSGDIQRLNHPLISMSQRLFDFEKTMGYSDKEPEVVDLYLGSYPH